MVKYNDINSRIKKRKRLMCFERQNGRCYYCGRQLQLENPKRYTYATIEHLKERRMGGTWRNDNIAVACRPCNNKQALINDVLYSIDAGIIEIVASLKPKFQETL